MPACLYPKSYGFNWLSIRRKIVSKKLETQQKKMENRRSVMDSPLSALDHSILGSSISDISEIEFGINNLVWMTNPGCSIDFLGLHLWSSGNTTTT